MDRRFLVTMEKLDGVFNREDVVGLLLVHSVEYGCESGRFPGTGWTRHKHDAVAPIHNFLQCLRQIQLLESRDFVGNDTHYNGATSALLENIYAETRHARDSVGKICGAILLELADRGLVFSHDVVGNRARVLRTETLQSFKFELRELAADLDLRSAARRENEVADVRAGLQHGGDELGGVNGPLRCGCRCWRRHLRGVWRRGLRRCPHELTCVLARPEKRGPNRVNSS